MQLVKQKLRHHQRGDTIVEVLIAIAVVGSVLGIAYSIMNSNIATLRDNQERSEASKVAQSQMELIKSKSISELEEVDGNFCISSNSGIQTDLALCKGVGGLYDVSISRNSSDAESYTVFVEWDGLNGNRNQVVMAYRLR